MAVPLSVMVGVGCAVFFHSPVTVRGQKEQRTSLSCLAHLAVNDGRLMSLAEVTAREQKHDVLLFVARLSVDSNSQQTQQTHTHKLTN